MKKAEIKNVDGFALMQAIAMAQEEKTNELKQALTKLRENGYSRTQLKDIVDEICNNVYIEKIRKGGTK